VRQTDNILPKYLNWNRHEVLQCALILGSAMRSFAGVAIATVKNFKMSISNSGVQCRTVIDFHFGFLGINIRHEKLVNGEIKSGIIAPGGIRIIK